jgi:hypothetical protein
MTNHPEIRRCSKCLLSAWVPVALLFSLASTGLSQVPPFEWVRSAGGTSYDEAQNVAVDATGNLYVTGHFWGQATFGTTTLGSPGSTYYQMFLSKLDGAGDFLWTRGASISSGSPDINYHPVQSVATDPDGNVFVAGVFDSSMSIGSTNFNREYGEDVFVAEYSSDGTFRRAMKLGIDRFASQIAYVPIAISIGTDRRLHVVGSFSGTARFGSFTITSAGDLDIFHATFDTNWNVIWAQKAGGITYDTCAGVAVDSDGASVLVGNFNGPANFGGIPLSGHVYPPRFDNDDWPAGYVAKYSANGGVLWANQISTGYDVGSANAIAIDAQHNCFVAGMIVDSRVHRNVSNRRLFVGKYDGSGNQQWLRHIGEGNLNWKSGQGVAVDAAGNCYVNGFFSGSIGFGSTNLSSAGDFDIFIAKYDGQGNLLWAKRAGQVFDDTGAGIAVDVIGNVYAVGTFYDSANFDSTYLVGNGSYEAFVTKLPTTAPVPPLITIHPQSQEVSFGTTITLSVTAGGMLPLSYQWRKTDANLIGQTNATLALTNVTLNDSGNYNVVVSNPAGAITSAVATLTVVQIPAITTEPQSQTVAAGRTAHFQINAIGTPPLSFRWLFNRTEPLTATNSTLNISNVQLSYAGDYTAVVTNAYGEVTSAVARLTVTPPVAQVVVDATLVAWGRYDEGQINVPPWLTDAIAIGAGGSHNLAIRSDNSVVAWGGNLWGNSLQTTVPFGLRSKAIAAGENHSLAVRMDGTVTAWGINGYGQIDVPPDLTNATAVAGGRSHSLALRTDGRVTAWGQNDYGQTDVPAGLTNVAAIAAGGVHSLALGSDGRVVAWGNGQHGQTNVPSFLTNAVAISAGDLHSLALTEQGRVVAWGYNDWGQGVVPFGISNAIAVECGGYFNLVLKQDGTVTAWGYSDARQQTNVPPGLTNVVAVAAAWGHSLALVGHAWPWVLSQLKSRTVVAGTTATLAVRASGTLPLSHQWRLNGTNLPAATNETLFIPYVQISNDGEYSVIITNLYGMTVSSNTALMVRYSLNLQASNGSITRSPAQSTYLPESEVTLVANPAPGYAFFYWSGGATGTNNPLTVTMTSNKVIRANFFPISLSVSVQGQGTVSKSPNRPLYDVGEQVTLTATPNRWFDFIRWGDGPTANPRVVTIGTNNNYTAIFSPTTAVETLTFSNVSRIAPLGMPALFVDGEFVVAGAVSRVDAADVSMLTTFPNGSIFYTLDGSTPSFAASLYGGPFSLNHSATVRAVAYDASFLNSWEADPVQVIIEPTFAVNTLTTGGGTVGVLPTAVSYRSNALVTLSATPTQGWTFLKWLGDATGTSATTSVRVMNRDLCAQALFGTTLGTTIAGAGSVVVDPLAALYPYGTVVRLTALPQPGNYFGAWGNAVMSTNNPLLLSVTNANTTVSCAFGPLSAGQVTLTVLVNGRGRVTMNPRGNRFPNNQSVTLTATADAEQEFLGWTGDATGTTTNLTIALTQSKVITANFTQRPRLSLGPCLGGWRVEGFQLTLTGEMGGRYRIEQSSGLMNWNTLESFTNTYGIWQIMDTTATNEATRFYRAVEEP